MGYGLMSSRKLKYLDVLGRSMSRGGSDSVVEIMIVKVKNLVPQHVLFVLPCSFGLKRGL